MQKSINWFVTNGLAKIERDEIRYIPNEQIGGLKVSGYPQYELCTVKSDRNFQEGEITFDLILSSEDNFAQLILGGNSICVSFNEGMSAFSIKVLNYQNQINILGSSGNKKILEHERSYHVKVSVFGSILKIFINNVEVLSVFHSVAKAAIAFNFGGSKEFSISNVLIKDNKPKVFVVMQFSEQFNELYENVIKPVCESRNLYPIRADDINNNGLILNDIIQLIMQSTVIIADITPDNPNVYYEVGFAHASNKSVILLCDKKRERLPFDLSGFRTIFYTNTISGKNRVQETLEKFLDQVFPLNPFA